MPANRIKFTVALKSIQFILSKRPFAPLSSVLRFFALLAAFFSEPKPLSLCQRTYDHSLVLLLKLTFNRDAFSIEQRIYLRQTVSDRNFRGSKDLDGVRYFRS